MNLVKIELDGKKIIADSRQTILEVARQHRIGNIPTLCHDDQLEPFASCFLCVVKVKGARSLVPACSTKVGAGMVVETVNDEIRRSRKAALELLLSEHAGECEAPCVRACPLGVDIPGLMERAESRDLGAAWQLLREANQPPFRDAPLLPSAERPEVWPHLPPAGVQPQIPREELEYRPKV